MGCLRNSRTRVPFTITGIRTTIQLPTHIVEKGSIRRFPDVCIIRLGKDAHVLAVVAEAADVNDDPSVCYFEPAPGHIEQKKLVLSSRTVERNRN